jgi:hypothetical protein
VSAKFDADIVSFTFAPVLSKASSCIDDSDYSKLLPSILPNVRLNGIIVEPDFLFSLLETQQYLNVFIGMDLDFEGNAMARILKDVCSAKGYDEKRVVRIPLTDKGFLFVSDFLKDNLMNKYLKFRLDEYEFLQLSRKTNGSHGIGRRHILLIDELLNPPEIVENINPQGTSSITYIFKKKIKEKYK